MWRAVVSQPLDRTCSLPQLGKLDAEAGEFWVSNPFLIPRVGENLSAYERNPLFINTGGLDFIKASFASGADIPSDSRGVIPADFNRDGAPDLFVASVGGGPLRLFQNRFPKRGAWTRLRLEGRESNFLGVGSRVIIDAGGRRIYRDLFANNGFFGQAPAEWLIGVGEAAQIDRLTLRWPNGTIQEFENLPVNTELRFVEGEHKFSAVQNLEPKTVSSGN